MPAFEAVKPGYALLWKGMVIKPEKVNAATIAANRCLAGKARYKDVERRTGVPWWFIALCHLREGNLRWETYLGNGQSIHRVTTIVPQGRGPFPTFEAGAVDALNKMGFAGRPKDYWTIERIMFCLEAFNGFGYRNFGVNSPYLWSGTNRYTSGKYVADHKFDRNVVDTQLGSMAVLSRMCALDAEVSAAVNGKGEAAVRDPVKDTLVVGGAAGAGGVAVGTQQGWQLVDYVMLGLKVAAVMLAAYVLLLLYRRLTAPKAATLPADHPALQPIETAIPALPPERARKARAAAVVSKVQTRARSKLRASGRK